MTQRLKYFLPFLIGVVLAFFIRGDFSTFFRMLVALYGILLLNMSVSPNGMLDKPLSSYTGEADFLQALYPKTHMIRQISLNTVLGLLFVGAEMFVIPQFFGQLPFTLEEAIIPLAVFAFFMTIGYLHIAYAFWKDRTRSA